MVSFTKIEIVAVMIVVQDILFLELKVELPMVFEMDNRGAVDIANSWSADGRIHHVDMHSYFLLKLKDQGLLVIRYIPRDSNADTFMKNVTSSTFNHHMPLSAGINEYIQEQG
jgi:hypothetical protein